MSPRRLWQFSRPHTVTGTSLSVVALFAMSAAFSPGGATAASARLVALTWVSALAANLYVVGLNQLRDVAVDRVNKPHLPLAAGTLSRDSARWIVGISGLVAVALAAGLGTWMLMTVAASMAIGSVYSLPPVHLKRFALGAAAAIAVVRGPIVNLGLFAHYQTSVGQAIVPTAPVLLLAAMMTFFGIAVAVAKDVPDVEGDRRFRYGTLAARLGPRVALVTSLAFLIAGYVAVTVGAMATLPVPQAAGVALAHLTAAAATLWSLKCTNAVAPASAARMYRRIWRLFYAEYVLFALVAVSV